MKETKRTRRISEAIRQDLSEILRREIHDPDLEMVSVTGVRVAMDFSVARVWISVIGDETAADRAMDALEGAKGRIRHLLAQRSRLRHTPALQFVHDETAAYAEKIERKLREVLPEGEAGDGEQSGD